MTLRESTHSNAGMTGTVVDRLAQDVEHLEGVLHEINADIERNHRQLERLLADRAECAVQLVEARAAHALVRDSGLRAELRDGMPFLSIDRQLTEPSATFEPIRSVS